MTLGLSPWGRFSLSTLKSLGTLLALPSPYEPLTRHLEPIRVLLSGPAMGWELFQAGNYI